MPRVSEPRKNLEIEEAKKLEERLKTIPGVYFPQYCNFGFGHATGYRYESHNYPDVYIFWDFNVAVVNNEMPDKAEKIKAIEALGYRVLKEEIRGTRWNNRNLDVADRILWEEMRKGFGQDRIRENLESLLVPIMTSFKGIKEFQFAVYDPCVVTSTDDVIPAYIEYDEVFSVKANDKGTLDFVILVDKLSKLKEGRALAISSRVLKDEGQRHIPMIDFKSEGVYFDDAIRMLQKLNLPMKFLVCSSENYGDPHYHHYYAGRLMNNAEFEEYLGLLKQQPEVGENWTEFQQDQEFALLRVTPSSSKLWFPQIEEVKEEDITDANRRK